MSIATLSGGGGGGRKAIARKSEADGWMTNSDSGQWSSRDKETDDDDGTIGVSRL